MITSFILVLQLIFGLICALFGYFIGYQKGNLVGLVQKHLFNDLKDEIMEQKNENTKSL